MIQCYFGTIRCPVTTSILSITKFRKHPLCFLSEKLSAVTLWNIWPAFSSTCSPAYKSEAAITRQFCAEFLPAIMVWTSQSISKFNSGILQQTLNNYPLSFPKVILYANRICFIREPFLNLLLSFHSHTLLLPLFPSFLNTSSLSAPMSREWLWDYGFFCNLIVLFVTL